MLFRRNVRANVLMNKSLIALQLNIWCSCFGTMAYYNSPTDFDRVCGLALEKVDRWRARRLDMIPVHDMFVVLDHQLEVTETHEPDLPKVFSLS